MTYFKQLTVARSAIAALAVVLTFVSPTQAQASECAQQWSKVADLLVDVGHADALGPVIARSMADGACRVNGIEFPLDRRTQLAIKSITWSGDGMDRFVAEGLPPRTLNIAINGISQKSASGMPGADRATDRYLATLSADLNLAAHWDENTRQASLDLLSIRFPQGDYLIAQAVADNVDFGSKAKMQMSVGGFSIPSAQITFDTIGTFEAFLSDPFGSALWGRSQDRTERVATMKDNVDLLPDDLVPPASKMAIKAFFIDAPKPNGAMRIDISATPGLGPVRFLPYVTGFGGAGPNEVWSVLQGVQIDVTYPAD